MNDMNFKKIDSNQADQIQHLARLNAFLKQHKEQKAAKGDVNFYLEAEQKIIACARLVKLKDGFWLRGVYVVEALRTKGIGSELMHLVHENMPNDCTIYAFPHGHLERFYGNLGYQLTEINDFPEALQQRFETALKQNKAWLAMARRGK